jgi:sulfur-oxidizing protein SoxY
MTTDPDGRGLNRRHLLIGLQAAAVTMALPSLADAQTAPAPLKTADETIAGILQGAKPVDGKLTVDMPEIAENGNVVPFQVNVDSPMTESDFVKSVHIIGTGNPQALIGTFQFTHLSGKAQVSSRMRLSKSQDIIVLANLSNGDFLMMRRPVKVTIGGCGGA